MTRKTAGLVLGPAIFFLILAVPCGTLPWPARVVAAGTAWIVCWWVTEAIPVAATSLLPIVLFPAFNALGPATVTSEYANQIIFLFIGGFFIAIAMEKWNLHVRIALAIVQRIGTSPRRIIAGFMAATAFVSAWISNTATAMAMMPVAAAVTGTAPENGTRDPRFGTALMLSVAYAASIGGVATLIGSPPNLILAGMSESLTGSEITFIQWAAFGVPIAAVLLVLCWIYLVFVAFPIPDPTVKNRALETMKTGGGISRGERRVLAVFVLVAALWISRAAWGEYLPLVTDSVIAVAGAILLFIIPSGNGERLLQWDDAKKIPWNVVLLFGCGLAIARGFTDTGLDAWTADRLQVLAGVPPALVLLAVIVLVVILTEITSNTATATVIIPVSAALAPVVGIAPLSLMIAAAISASLAFMLPVATPPNAIVYATGQVTMSRMIRAGIVMNLVSIAVLMVCIPIFVP